MYSILAARTDFSIGESILSTEDLIQKAVDAGQRAVALTDTMSVTGMIDFTKRAKKVGLKPVIGTRLRLTDDPTWRPAKGEKKKHMPRSYFLTIYALKEAGMKAIFRLLTLANSDDRFYYEPKLGFDDLLNELRELDRGDVAIVLGDAHSVLEHPEHEKIVGDIRPLVEHFYAPLIPVNTPYYGRLNQIAIDLIEKGICAPIVVRPAFYGQGEADAQEIMTAVASNVKVSDPWFLSRFNRDLHVVSVRELVDHIKLAVEHLNKRGVANGGLHFKEGLINTGRLVAAVEYEWTKQQVSLPQMAPDEFKAVVEACKEGWTRRFKDEVFGHRPTDEELEKVYKPRLAYELSVLKRLNFSGYFLLVQDVVQFAKKNGILVGPGRGSVGGSLVAYLMGITECDPIRFGLLFERFINPERIDLPDADLDFMSERRHEVIEYLIKKYGANRVAGVSNFGTLGAASSIRDVGRVMEIPEREYSVSKYVPKVHGQPVPLPEAKEVVPEIAAFADKYPEIWQVMERLEGSLRNLSQHAAGVVVAGCDLVERAVIEPRKDGNVVCWDKRIVEDQGLVKIDVLGLSTLDQIKLTLDYIRERHGTVPDLMRIPLDDQRVLENFAKGNTTAIFQYEGGSARRMLKEMARNGIPLTFADVAAVSALNRPGPLEAGLDRLYIENRDGTSTPTYVSPHMENALKDTFGAIVYQEQVMQIAKDLSGFSGSEADVLRKAIGKKDADLMAEQKEKFIEGAVLGYIEVTLEDGTVKKVHRAAKFPVHEAEGLFTVEEIYARGYTLKVSL